MRKHRRDANQDSNGGSRIIEPEQVHLIERDCPLFPLLFGLRRCCLGLWYGAGSRRLLLRARKHGAKQPDHYLMPKHLSRIMRGPDKGRRGYDPLQYQVYWDTGWHSLTTSVRCPECKELQAPTDTCQDVKCKADLRNIKSETAGLRFHDLRHTFITHMVELGVPIGTIQAFVGHMSSRMLRHYTHISSGAARRAVEFLDAEPILKESLHVLENGQQQQLEPPARLQ